MVRKLWLACVLAFALCPFLLAGCSSNPSGEVWYENEEYVIRGFEHEVAEGIIPLLVGTVYSKGDASTSGFNAYVALYDSDGRLIAKCPALSEEVPPGGKAEFTIYLYGDNDFLTDDEVDSIATIEPIFVMTSEDSLSTISAATGALNH